MGMLQYLLHHLHEGHRVLENNSNKILNKLTQINCSLLCSEVSKPLFVTENTEDGLLCQFLFYCELRINTMVILHSLYQPMNALDKILIINCNS